MPDRPQEVKIALCSSAKARRLLGYEAKTSLDEGLDEVVGWIKQNGAKEFEYYLPIEIVNEMTPRSWTDRLI